jgi:hypothetical protein
MAEEVGSVDTVAASVGSIPAAATGQSERLPRFQFLGRYLDDRV